MLAQYSKEQVTSNLPLRVLSVGDRVTDDVLQEDLEDTTGLLVDEARDTLHTTTTCETTNGRLGDTYRTKGAGQ